MADEIIHVHTAKAMVPGQRISGKFTGTAVSSNEIKLNLIEVTGKEKMSVTSIIQKLNQIHDEMPKTQFV